MKEIARIFEDTAKYLRKYVSDLKPEHLTENYQQGPSINWLIGHIAIYRHLVARKLGFEEPEHEWAKAFDFGSVPGEPLPKSVEELVSEIERITPEICSRIRNLPQEERERVLEDGSTVGENVAFFLMHDAYHLGQIAYIRARLGYPWPFTEE